MVAKWPFTPPPEPPRAPEPPLPVTGWRLACGALLAAGASAALIGVGLGVVASIAWWTFRFLTGV
jgi:hypothetical protein